MSSRWSTGATCTSGAHWRTSSAPLHGQLGHDVNKRLERALFSTSDWDRFVHEIKHEDQTATPMPAALRWLGMYGQRIRDQAANCDRGPYSTGPVEAVNLKLATLLHQRPHDDRKGTPSLFA